MEEASSHSGIPDVRGWMGASDFRGAWGTSVVADEIVRPRVKILEDVRLASGVRRVAVLVEVAVFLAVLGGGVAVGSGALQMEAGAEKILDGSKSSVA